MKPKNHYTILGISRRESPEGVRTAYRRLAKRVHPDLAGAHAARAFREVQQAYDVLSDPERRRRYDREIGPKRPARAWRADPVPQGFPVEPLVPDPPAAAPGWWSGRSPVEPLETSVPGDRVKGGVRRSSIEAIELDLALSAQQAAHGGTFTVRIPLRGICPACVGSRLRGWSRCRLCGGSGRIVREREFRLGFAPGVRHGTTVTLGGDRAEGPVVRVRVFVDRTMRAPP